MDLESDLLRLPIVLITHNSSWVYPNSGPHLMSLPRSPVARRFPPKTRKDRRIKGMAGNNQEGDFHIVSEILCVCVKPCT